MIIENYSAFVENNSVGTIQNLNKFQLNSIKSIVSDLTSVLTDNCDSHALYRCTLFAKGNDICMALLGSDERGRLKELPVIYDMDTGELHTKGIHLSNKSIVISAIINVLSRLDRLPYSVGLLQFPFDRMYYEGVVADYKYERGTKLICIKDVGFEFFRA